MKKYLQENIVTRLDMDNRQVFVVGVGFATFFFGFAAGAIANVYLLAIHSPLVTTLRASLTYKSSIFGDGFLLPVVNMIAASFLLSRSEKITARTKRAAIFLGSIITIWFHVDQATHKIVNWAMPTPWHWNALGVWHAGYMFAVASFISCFYLVLLKTRKNKKLVPKEALFVTLGYAIFFMLLRWDYIAINLSALLPHF